MAFFSRLVVVLFVVVDVFYKGYGVIGGVERRREAEGGAEGGRERGGCCE